MIGPIKACVNCRHSLEDEGSYFCSLSRKGDVPIDAAGFNLVTGRREDRLNQFYHFCAVERSRPASPIYLCGAEGNRYEPKEKAS